MDYRDRANIMPKWYKSLDERNMMATVEYYSENSDEEIEEQVPFIYEVCDVCNGTGSHVNPSIDSHGLTHEDFEEDPDFFEDYMNGEYNVTCYKCNGNRVVPIINKSKPGYEDIIKQLEEQFDSHCSEIESDYRTRMIESGYW